MRNRKYMVLLTFSGVHEEFVVILRDLFIHYDHGWSSDIGEIILQLIVVEIVWKIWVSSAGTKLQHNTS